MRARLTEVMERLDEVSTQSESILAQMEETARQQVAQLESQTASFVQQVQLSTERLDRDVSSIQESFRSSQSERAEEFKTAQENREQDYHRRLDPTIVDIEDFRDQAKSMLEEVAGSSTAQHYANQRDKQGKDADRWRWVGVSALVCLVVATGALFVELRMSGGDISIGALVYRSGLPFSLLLLATYALRQSGHHRQREEDISRVSNELMLLWPFMNRLPEEDRKELLFNITPLYFKGGLTPHDAGDKVSYADKMVDKITRRNQP